MTFLPCNPGWFVHKSNVQNKWNGNILQYSSSNMILLAIFLCTGTAVLEFNYEGEARESFFLEAKRRAARFATSSSLFLTYLVVISSDFNTDFCVAPRPGSSEVPRDPLTRWDVSSIPANGIFLTEKLKNKIKMPNGWVEND